jgi:general secretion pathway protein I
MISHPERRMQAGFTLLEAMVALVIVALGMMAVNTQLGRFAVTAIHIEQKTLASWIATNKITELSVQPEWPALGEQEEDVDFAGRSWLSRTEISETPVPNLRRIDVSVSFADSPDDVVHRVTGLVEPPPPQGIVPLNWMPAAAGAGG